MKIAFNPSNSSKNILDLIKTNKDIIFDLKGHSIYARGVEFKGTDTNTWRDIKINNVSIGSHTLDLRNGNNTTLTNTNGVVTINSTWRPVVDNLTSNSTTSSLSANQGRVLAGLINTLDTNISNQYALRNGSNATGRWRGGLSCFDVRDTNYTPHDLNMGLELLFLKNDTNNLKDGGMYNGVFSFRQWSSGSDWSRGKAHQLSFTDNENIWHRTSSGDDSWGAWKKLAYSTDIPSSLKNPYALTISLNGTSQGPYDGSVAKNINITPGSIGAATSGHNHDDRYLKLTGGVLKGQIILPDIDVNTSYTGSIIIGASNTENLGIDGNEIMARNNGKASTLYLNNEGGAVQLGAILRTNSNIAYIGSQSTQNMIKFINNTSDSYGNGIAIGGGGLTIIGSGESSDVVMDQHSSGGDENMIIAGDGTIDFYSNLQDGWKYGKHMYLDTNGFLFTPSYINIGGNENNNSSPDRVWGSNSSDSYLRSYRTSALRVAYASSAGSATSATKVIVNQHTTNDINYPLVWSNQANTSNVTENQLYKSWADLYYNPKNKRLTVGGSVVTSSFIKSGGTSQQLLRADGGIASFNWTGQSGQPAWLWGGNSEHSYYVYNPSNFRVAYASSAGNADTLDGEHASSFVRAGAIEVGSLDLNALDTYSFIKSVNSQVAGHSPKGNIGWYNVIQLVHRNGADDGPSYIGQIALGMTTNVNDIFFRTRRTDPWKTIIHSNNYTEFIDNYYWANVKISTSANTQTTPSVNTIFANNWFRSQGDTGWYNESYGGGIRMTDTKWIRTFGGKSFYCDSQISSQGFHHLNHDNNDAVLLAGGSYMIHKTGSTSYSTAIQFGNYVWLTLSTNKATSNCQVVPYNISNPTKNVYVTSIQIGNYDNSRNGVYRVAPNGKLYHVQGTEEGAIHATICYIAS